MCIGTIVTGMDRCCGGLSHFFLLFSTQLSVKARHLPSPLNRILSSLIWMWACISVVGNGSLFVLSWDGMDTTAKMWCVAVIVVHHALAIICMVVDPGFLPLHERRTTEEDEKEVAGMNGAHTKAARCEPCDADRPLRSKHCDECGRCVLRYDHHCVWIGRCVGANNHRLFLAGASACALNFFCVAFYLWLGIQQNVMPLLPNVFSFLATLLFSYPAHTFLIAIMTLGFLSFVILVVYQLRLVVRGVTTAEHLHANKMIYFFDANRRYHNPFNLGALHNVLSFLGVSWHPASKDWVKARMYTIFDLPNHPLQEVVRKKLMEKGEV
uniref:Palmitoyltransferase n=1 Tax=Palpitomonas bilix TaxID=652834 RepID=A0A7S3G164_9EUKA